MTFDFSRMSLSIAFGFLAVWLLLLAVVWLPKPSTPEARYMEWQRLHRLPEISFEEWLFLPRTATAIPPRYQSTLWLSVGVGGLFFYYLVAGCQCVRW